MKRYRYTIYRERYRDIHAEWRNANSLPRDIEIRRYITKRWDVDTNISYKEIKIQNKERQIHFRHEV